MKEFDLERAIKHSLIISESTSLALALSKDNNLAWKKFALWFRDREVKNGKGLILSHNLDEILDVYEEFFDYMHGMGFVTTQDIRQVYDLSCLLNFEPNSEKGDMVGIMYLFHLLEQRL